MKKKTLVFLIILSSLFLMSCDRINNIINSSSIENNSKETSNPTSVEPSKDSTNSSLLESSSETLTRRIEPSTSSNGSSSDTSSSDIVDSSTSDAISTSVIPTLTSSSATPTSTTTSTTVVPVIEYKTVSFDTKGGKKIDDILVEAGKVVDIPETTNEGWTLEGWYLDSKYLNYFDVNTPIEEDIKLYAYWTLDSDEYVYVHNYLNNGRTIRIPYNGELYNFETAQGCTLEGLYTSSDYDKRIKLSDLYDGCTIYCKWKENNEYVPLEKKVDLTSFIDKLISDTINSDTPYIPSWNKESYKDRWNYIDGVFLKSIVNLYYETNDEKYKKFVHDYVNYYINENGEFVRPEANTTDGAFNDKELDSICESFILFDLAKWYSDDTRYEKAIAYTYQKLMNMNTCEAYGSPNFWHKESYPNQIWLDGMYMYGPFMARYAKEKNVNSLFDLLKSQYEYISENMRNSEFLLVHGLDTSKSVYWAENDGKSKNVWLRSLGWFLCSLVDSIEYFPEGSNRDYLIGLLGELSSYMEGLIDYDTRMLYQLPLAGNQIIFVPAPYLEALNNKEYKIDGGYYDTYISNYFESSGSSMIAYSLLKASRLGYTRKYMGESGKMLFEGTYENSFDSESNVLKDICITAGLGPQNKIYRDGSIEYYLAEPVGENDAKGVGPFIMAYLEYLKLSN